MKHGLSFYIDDKSQIIGACGSILIKTDDSKSAMLYDLNEDQLSITNALYVGQDGKGRALEKIDTENPKECAIEFEKISVNGSHFVFEEWCTCAHCGYSHALFIPRNYCPKCGYKFTTIIYKGAKIKEDKDGQKIEGDARADSTCKGD